MARNPKWRRIVALAPPKLRHYQEIIGIRLFLILSVFAFLNEYAKCVCDVFFLVHLPPARKRNNQAPIVVLSVTKTTPTVRPFQERRSCACNKRDFLSFSLYIYIRNKRKFLLLLAVFDYFLDGGPVVKTAAQLV